MGRPRERSEERAEEGLVVKVDELTAKVQAEEMRSLRMP
jgi:hypothetical protein